MIRVVQAALDHHGIDDTIAAVGQFAPRGMSGSSFAGLMVGGEVGSAFGDVGDIVGSAAGALGGGAANARARGLPQSMFVGASDSMIYGFKMHTRRKEPHDLVFQLSRESLDVKVHGRLDVRVLELIDTKNGSKVELEGSRVPITHAHDLIKFLVGDEATTTSKPQSSDDN